MAAKLVLFSSRRKGCAIFSVRGLNAKAHQSSQNHQKRDDLAADVLLLEGLVMRC